LLLKIFRVNLCIIFLQIWLLYYIKTAQVSTLSIRHCPTDPTISSPYMTTYWINQRLHSCWTVSESWPIELHLCVVSHLQLSIFIHQVWINTVWVSDDGTVSSLTWRKQRPQSRTLILSMFQLLTHRLKVFWQQLIKNVKHRHSFLRPC